MRTIGTWLGMAALLLSGCGGGGGKASSRAAAAATAPGSSPPSAPASPGSSSSTSSGSGTSGSGTVSAAGSTASPTSLSVFNLLAGAAAVTTSAGPSTGGASGGGAAGVAAPPAAAAPAAGAVLLGTIPPDPTTGFDGTLFLAGERLAPGSVLLVTVNGVPTKTLPATFHSSELLSTYVYLTVPATYTFTAIAPDGTSSAPVTLTVPNGGPATLVGVNAPSVQMVYPPRVDGSFAGTVWLLGDQFMPGAVATVQQPNLPPLVVPLLVVNERTAAWVVGPLQPGSATITVTNPTLLSSTAVTLPVGATPPGGAPGATPSAWHAGGVTSPFLGTVTVYGADLALGAAMEMRRAGSTTASSTPLVRISSGEAWWTLVYPAPGTYEVRVVNPGGAASAWTPFDVR